ncbi:polysaccharide lyase family 8 super-sandwich domain-containing protein [Algoriphagus sediminis]|uniref:Polysaccharide lyase family 8 super-sandwich domain-containing protein n=1 Tax=Algoriphagus sediminis TaxID=3057113 RepID=A0ABT7Y8W7_9BACT|nr:polysaccharide lyase family 8 super-sandwich domain-containing protein [Algoriphagus sediminis]MDN3202916.1 polysaccharide lyase family 8 super-sandwich domain-containing protein [Algoriphagus sediminis]
MKTFLSLLVILVFQLFSNSVFSQESDYEIIANRVFDEYQKSMGTEDLDERVASYLEDIKADGSWPDLEYSSKSMTGWDPDKHIKRLGSLTKAYTRTDSKYNKSPEVHTKILSAIDFWNNLSPEPTSDNWWWTSISLPKEIGQILIALRKAENGISEEQEKGLLEWMNKTVSIYKSPGSEGSNLTDIAQHMIMQAVLTDNPELMDEAISEVSKSIKITTGDGIQRDMSFHAHGPELYIHGYGREYLLGIRNVAVYTKGTQFAIAPEKIALISDFMRNGYLNVIRGRYVDHAVLGRGVAVKNNVRTSSALVKQIRDIDIDEHREEYNQAIARIEGKADPGEGVKPSNTYYWRSDYIIHHRPEFMVSVNVASKRTIRTESGNGVNLSPQWMTEGAMTIAVKGDEYYNVFPNWQWYRIPGTTTPENKKLKKRTNWVAEPGKADYVGGVSDGLNGISAFLMDDYSTQARKSWFFFDDLIVCLGTGIGSSRTEKIATNINQVKLRGDVWADSGAGFKKMDKGLTQFSDPVKWIYHDGVGYYFPKEQNVVLSAQKQDGSWSEITKNGSKDPIDLEIFNLYIDHGVKPQYNSYEYILAPGVPNQSAAGEKPVDQIEVLSNKTFAQVVKDERTELYGMVFYEKSSFDWDENSVSVSHPLILQLKKKSNEEWELHVAEPTQLIKGEVSIRVKFGSKSKTIKFELPEGDLAGSTLSETFSL